MKIRPVGPELFYADGQMDMTKPIVAFRQFANAPENEAVFYAAARFLLPEMFLVDA
jgi:hypothetical protein